MMKVTCKNCNNSFKGNFCNECGQTANTHEINFKSVLHEIQHGIFHVDRGILFTTKELLLRPGITIRAYLAGKRIKHFKPFAYILILSTIYSLLIRLKHKSTFLNSLLDGFYDVITSLKSDRDFQDSLGHTDVNEKIGIISDAIRWMSGHYAYTTLLIIPIFSLASYICFYRTNYNYFQHLILNSYAAGQRTAVFLLLLPITYFITDADVNNTIDNITFYLGICLNTWTYYQFFNTTKRLQNLLLSLLTYVVLLMQLVVFIVVIVIISIL